MVRKYTVLATDPFTGTNGDPLSGNWDDPSIGFEINTNQIRPPVVDETAHAYYTGIAWPGWQYAEVTLVDVTGIDATSGDNGGGVICNAQPGTSGDFYYGICRGNLLSIKQCNANFGDSASLASKAFTPQAGDRIRLESRPISPTQVELTLYIRRGGTLTPELGPVIDTLHQDGDVGVYSRVGAADAIGNGLLEDFEGGSIEEVLYDGAFGGGFDPWGDEAWGEDVVEDQAVTGALQASTQNTTADFDGTVVNPVIGDMDPTTDPTSADFNGVVANPIVGALATATENTTANFDAVLSILASLQALLADAQADFNGVVANPVSGAIQAFTQDTAANFDAVLGHIGILAALTQDTTANFDGLVVDAIAGELDANTGDAQANFDGQVTSPVTGALQAVTEPTQANLDGVVAQPVVGSMDADLQDTVANFDGDVQNPGVQPQGGGTVFGWGEGKRRRRRGLPLFDGKRPELETAEVETRDRQLEAVAIALLEADEEWS